MGGVTLLAQLRARGHTVQLQDLRVRVLLRAGADVAKARAWCLAHEQQLRAELVSEVRSLCRVPREVFDGARVRQVCDAAGKPISGAVDVVEAASFEAAV